MKTLTIGRHPDNDIVIEDKSKSVSRFHAKVTINDDGTYTILDKSTNGVFVNGKRIKPNVEFYIYPGDKINLANVEMLDWGRLEIPSVKKTKVRSLVGSMLLGVTEAGEKFQNIKLYGYLIQAPAKRIMGVVRHSAYRHAVDPYKFYSLFLGIYVFVFFFFVKKQFEIDDFSDFLAQFAYSLLVAITILAVALVTYFFFKTFTGQERSRREYLHMTLLYNGLMLPPAIPALYLQHSNMELAESGADDETMIWRLSIYFLVALATTIYSIVIWVKLNKYFWDISYRRTILIYFSAILILIVGLSLVGLAIVFIIASLN